MNIDGTMRLTVPGVFWEPDLCFLIPSIEIYGKNYVEDIKRIKYIKDEASEGKKTVTVKRLPFEYYLWNGSPTNKERTKEYERFYGIPDDISIKVE